jgi:putative colanic acid biosynthesis acetyltransferase WcaF
VVSQDVYFCGGTHDYTRPHYPLQRLAIRVEDDVWIGAGAFICPGARIGQGAVVGARAVVAKDVPPWKVVAGNPARVIKYRLLTSD